MKKIIFIAIACTVAIHVQAQKGKKKKTVVAEKVVLKTEIDSFSYALGMSIGESLKNTGSTNVNTDLLTKAMKQIFNNNQTVMSKEDANNTLQQKLQAFTQRKKEAQIQEGKAFLFINGKRPNVTTLPNGLQYEVLIPANMDNPKPRITDTVKVNYAGSLITGVEFENSIKNGGPVTFPVNGVVRGWQQALQLMPKGATWKIYIPSELGYGENPPSYDIPQNAVLIFEIALIDIKAAQTPDK
jgi:FKBP-type peptidyl-prolyl cis-trans isomerase FklB